MSAGTAGDGRCGIEGQLVVAEDRRFPLGLGLAEATATPRGVLVDLGAILDDVVTDEVRVLPALLQDVARDGAEGPGIGAGQDLEVDAAVLLGVGRGERLARVDVDDLRAAGLQPLSEGDGLRLVGIGAKHHRDIGLGVVGVAGAEGVDAAVIEPGGVGAVTGVVVRRDVGRADRVVRKLGDDEVVLEVLVRVVLEAHRELAVLLDGVGDQLGDDLDRGVPGDGLEGAIDA